MKVLSIREPWASIIINGYKEYEFRSWKTNYRGKILIHASKNIEKENVERFKELNLNYKQGFIIGEAELVDCIPVTKEFENNLIKLGEKDDDESNFGRCKKSTRHHKRHCQEN